VRGKDGSMVGVCREGEREGEASFVEGRASVLIVDVALFGEDVASIPLPQKEKRPALPSFLQTTTRFPFPFTLFRLLSHSPIHPSSLHYFNMAPKPASVSRASFLLFSHERLADLPPLFLRSCRPPPRRLLPPRLLLPRRPLPKLVSPFLRFLRCRSLRRVFSRLSSPSLTSLLPLSPSTAASKAPAKKSTAKAPKAESDKSDKKKRNKKRVETYSSYIYKVLKQVHPDTGISNKAMSILNSFVNDIFEVCLPAFSVSVSHLLYASRADLAFLPFLLCLANRFRGFQARFLQQEVYHLVSRDPDLGPTHPARRALQARHFRGHQVRYEYVSHFPLSAPTCAILT
jgi:hypothetical protein